MTFIDSVRMRGDVQIVFAADIADDGGADGQEKPLPGEQVQKPAVILRCTRPKAVSRIMGGRASC